MAFKILTGSCEYYYDTLLTGGPVNIYSYDAKGNVSDIINGDTGVIAAHYEYSPFGETVVQAGDAQVVPAQRRIDLGWAHQRSVVNKSINSGTTNTHRIDLPLKIHSCDIISPMFCLTSLKIAAEL